MRIRVCHLNRVDKMSLIIFRNLHLSIEFTIVVFLTLLHTEEYPFLVKYALYYIYFMKTHHSIFYIVLINSYDHRFIENITLPILNRHKIVWLVKAGILMILANYYKLFLSS